MNSDISEMFLRNAHLCYSKYTLYGLPNFKSVAQVVKTVLSVSQSALQV